ncbi:required for meiotic nuclear division protein 1 homolog isoform X1 [Periplaneta americana]|uniref:required for meiotic nuclear division protein 1 homolog isoform X1 n=1 Tax=Periplaneta americana TaxID=6978 RepID=UPI0037E84354
MLSSKCSTKVLNFFQGFSQFHSLKSYVGYSLHHHRVTLVTNSVCTPKYFSQFCKNVNSFTYTNSGMPTIRNYFEIISRYGAVIVTSRTLKTKGVGSHEPQGIHENVSALQIKTRQRRKRPTMEEEDTEKLGYWNVIAYTTAEEYDLEKLTKGLIQQNLYVQNSQLRSVVERGQTVPDVVHVAARYQVGDEPREIYFFREGTVVFWNVPELESSNVLTFLRQFEENSYDERLVHDESEIMPYTRTIGKKSHLQEGYIVLGDEGDVELDKYTFSNAMALSVKLGAWEASLNRYVDSIEFVSEDLKKGTKLSMSREDVLRKTGELFALRHVINLSSDLLDTPDFYWDHDEQEDLYQRLCNYFSINRRTRVMNEKLNHCLELVELLSTHLSDRHHTRLEWMIIILIMVEVVFEFIHYAERFM